MPHAFRTLCLLPILAGLSLSAVIAPAATSVPAAPLHSVTGQVVDASTRLPLASRVYLQKADGTFLFPVSASPEGSAVRYEKVNWNNRRSVEMHTTLSAHPWRIDLPAGRYVVGIERGKEYVPLVGDLVVTNAPVSLEFALRRWINLGARGWYSGDTHVHRTLAELPNVMLAEDLNVALPLTYWTTIAGEAPAHGNKTLSADAAAPAKLLRVDDTHVIWPRNTEYEIFKIGAKNHTLGALFLLNHRTAFTNGVPPWGPVAAQAKAEGALLDMDKLDWPFAMMLPHSTGARLYELANNHMWRTEFGFTNWNTFAPPYLQPPHGGRHGNEREWTLYTFGMYYTLLNAGYRCVPSAGTASGVHPVPLGFSRAYVHLPDGFSYEKWIQGLAAGRSFITTGPMLFATVNNAQPGERFRQLDGFRSYRVAGTVASEQPLAFIEVIRNGIAVQTIMPQNKLNADGARETTFSVDVPFDSSGWLTVRCWEDRNEGRFRWAHSAPWHIEVPGRPIQPRREEKQFLVSRAKDEIARSRDLLAPESRAEYDRALEVFEKLPVADDAADVQRNARPPRDEADLRAWLENMVWHHRFSVEEIRAATGLEAGAIQTALTRLNITATTRPARAKDAPLLALPYPGGRHPRTGFLDGAQNPQRDTKFSVFTPWDDRSYVVADFPEAIWSNLGLTYLAHEHIPTLWSSRNVKLPPLEWERRADGTLEFERRLPNGIAFGTRVQPRRDSVLMETWLRNGTDKPLTGLRFQNCVMLKAAAGFAAQTGANKVLRAPYAACRSEDGRRWIITAWDPIDAPWQNPPVPCIHANPKFPDCPPGETVRARGWLSFHEGPDIEAELKRIDATGWRTR